MSRISSLTGIPRSTVGYCVRKFSKLSAKCKPVVFPAAYGAPREASTRSSHWEDLLKRLVGMNALGMIREDGAERLYYTLMDFKLIEELGHPL